MTPDPIFLSGHQGVFVLFLIILVFIVLVAVLIVEVVVFFVLVCQPCVVRHDALRRGLSNIDAMARWAGYGETASRAQEI